MNAQPPLPAGPPMSVPGTLAEVYALLWSNRNGFLRVVLIPAAASFLLAAIGYNVEEKGVLLTMLAADLIPTTLFAVAWHRLILLGPQAMSAPGLRWGARETAYLWRTVAITIGSLVAMAIPVSLATAIAQRSVVGHLLILFISLTALFVMMRLSLVLPASAVDARYGFAQSWNDTAARGFQLVVIAVGVALPLFLALQLFNGLTAVVGLAAAAPFTVMLLNSVGSYILLAALLTVLALAFGRLSGWPQGGATAAGT